MADPHAAASHHPHDEHGPHAHHPTPFERLVALLRPDRGDIAVVLAYAVAVGLLALAMPVAVQTLVSTVAFGTLLQPLVVLAILLLVGLGFAAVMRGLQAVVVELVQRRLFVRVAAAVAERLPRVRLEALDRVHGPELVNRFFDVVTLQKGAATLLVDGLSVALQTVVGLLVLALYHPVLLGFGVMLAVAMALVLAGLGRGGTDTSIAESRAKYEVAAWLEELARHPTTFRARPSRAYAEGRTVDLVREYLARRARHFRVVLRQLAGSLALQAIASAALLGLGGYLVIQRQLTLGQLIAAELIVTSVVSGFSKLGKYVESWYDLVAAADKVGHLMDLPVEREGGAAPWDAGAAGVRVIGAAARAGGHEVLRDIDIEVAPGERVVIVGPEGAGKTVLGELIAGAREPSRGRLEIDGVDARALDLEVLRAQVALVRGDEVFAGTVTENVAAGRPGIGPREVRAALEAVGLWEDVARMPDGAWTELATGGAPLSSGQARRVALARAIAGRPRLLVVDDLGAEDPAARRRVLDGLCDPAAQWTLVLLARDERDLAARGRVLRIAGGRLEEPR